MSKEEYEAILEEYDTFIEIYNQFEENISINTINRIIICRDNFKYCYENNRKFTKRARCKTRQCPMCNRKMKGKKFFEIKEKIERFKEKYYVFALTLNGKNVECDVEKIKKEMRDNDKKFKELKKFPFFKKVVRVFLKVTEIKFDKITNDVCPHLHIILFVIKSFYKHTNIRKMSKEIKLEWDNLKQASVNVFLKGISTKNINVEKTSRTISYLTTSKKKRLSEMFGENIEMLKIYLDCIKYRKLYIWGNIEK